jgi:hypothetical protein
MQSRYSSLFQALINKIHEAETDFAYLLTTANMGIGESNAYQHSLDVLKAEGLENTESFEKLKKRSEAVKDWKKFRGTRTYNGIGSEQAYLWGKLQELAKRCANENLFHLSKTTIEFDFDGFVKPDLGDVSTPDPDELTSPDSDAITVCDLGLQHPIQKKVR